MIEFIKQDKRLLLRYKPDRFRPAAWIDNKLKEHGYVTIKRTFTFDKKSFIKDEKSNYIFGDTRTFVLGTYEGGYYIISRNILDLKYDLLISREMPLKRSTFIAYRDISVFYKIDKLVNEQIIVGGDAENAIPVDEFEKLLENFPTSTELTHYSGARISRVLADYFETMSDPQKKLDEYIKRKKTIRPISRINFIENYELQKFEYVRDELRQMLEDAEAYSEKEWQKLIVEFLLLLFPKYIVVLENLNVKDFYSNQLRPTDRFIDLALIDASGAIDIVEIKKPFENCILSRSKYRDNFIPRTELSGSVMQVEKYLFHLNKWGHDGEINIMRKRGNELPANFEIKITNPKGMIIIGRSSDFVRDQEFDFEIIRRKYANVIDIMTYDDLLQRIDNIIAMIRRKTT